MCYKIFMFIETYSKNNTHTWSGSLLVWQRSGRYHGRFPCLHSEQPLWAGPGEPTLEEPVSVRCSHIYKQWMHKHRQKTPELTVKSQAWTNTRHRHVQERRTSHAQPVSLQWWIQNWLKLLTARMYVFITAFFKTSVYFKSNLSPSQSNLWSSTPTPKNPLIYQGTRKSIQSSCSELHCCQLLFCLLPAVSAIYNSFTLVNTHACANTGTHILT